jgi:hypothetical protein
MNVFTPVILIFVGVFVRNRGIEAGAVTDLGIFFWVLIAVAASEIPAIYIVKRTFLSRARSFQKGGEQSTVGQAVIQMGMIIFALSLAPTIYGLVYYLLGGSLERFVLFAALTLFCFMLFKPKQEEISVLLKTQGSAEDSQSEV